MIEVYKQNTQMVRDISSDQEDILRTLNSIESELDQLLSGDVIHHKKVSEIVDFYNNPTSKSAGGSAEANFYEYRASRQQVFQKAFTIEQLTEELSQGLSEVERAIDQTQRSTE